MLPSIDVYLAVPASGSPSLLQLVFDADPIVQLDLLLLLVMSIACWAIIVEKGLRLRSATATSASFLDAFWQAKRLDQIYEDSNKWAASPVALVFQAGYKELARLKATQGANPADFSANVERALRRAAQVESTRLRRFVTVLATTGSTAPFIGLFGTVWGILGAFLKLGEPGAAATIQVVGPDIAHALVATAVGLVAAIPAVMAYNTYNAWIGTLDIEMDNFSADFLNLVKRRS